jgi:hypothetical protein
LTDARTGFTRTGVKSPSVIIAFLASWIVGCTSPPAKEPAAGLRNPSLDPFVGQHVTLRGAWRAAGKFGPCLVVGNTPIYVRSMRSGRNDLKHALYKQLDRRPVEVAGTLYFEHYPANPTPRGAAPLSDHYWFEDETVKIRELSDLP